MKLALTELVQDFSVYPRLGCSLEHIQTLVAAIEAGVKLPPIIICRKTRKVVDGFHRVKAYTEAFGCGIGVEVEERDYVDDKALFLDAIKSNASHGQTFSSGDRKLAIERAMAFKIDPELVASALNMKVERVARFCSPTAKAITPAARVSVSEPLPNAMGAGQIIRAQSALRTSGVKSIGQFQLGIGPDGLPVLKKANGSATSFAIPLEVNVNGRTSVFEVFVGN